MDILTHTLVLQSIADTSSCILHMIEKIFTSEDIKKFLDNEDVYMKLKVINLFIYDISECKNIDSVKLLLDSINNNVTNIYKSLQIIQMKIDTHKSKYFYYYRTVCTQKEKQIIMFNNKLMNNRFDLLIKMLQIKF